MTNLTIELDNARGVMYEELCDALGEKPVTDELEAALHDHLTELYDRRDELQAARQDVPPQMDVDGEEVTPHGED